MFHILNRHRLVKETVDFNDMEVLKDKYSIEFLSRVKQWAFTQAVSPYWRGPSRKSKKKKRKLEKNESARARNSGSEAQEKWALRRAIPFYLVLNWARHLIDFNSVFPFDYRVTKKFSVYMKETKGNV